MRKRFAMITITALTAVGGLAGGAAASMKPAPSHSPSCPGADLTCKA